MAARAKIEEDPKKVYITDIPEDVRKNVIYPMLPAHDLFTTARLSKKEGALSKDVLEDSRLEALQTKRDQLFELIKQRDMENMLFYERKFPLIRSFPPDMDVVNDQLDRIVPTIKMLKGKKTPQFQRSLSIDYSGIVDSDGILLSQPPKKKGGGFWDNDDYIKWKKDYDEGNWGKKGYTGSGGWSDMIPFRHQFGLGKKSYRELERMSGGGNEPQNVEQYFKDKSYWAYRPYPRDLQGGADRPSPPRSPDFPPYRPQSPDFPPPSPSSSSGSSPDYPPPSPPRPASPYRPRSPDHPPPQAAAAAAAAAVAAAPVGDENKLKEVEKRLGNYSTRHTEGSVQVFKMASASDADDSIPDRLDFPTQVGFAFKPYNDGKIRIGIYFKGELVSDYVLEQDRYRDYDDVEKFIRKNPDFKRKYDTVKKLFDRLEESYLIPRFEERDDDSALGEAEMFVINEGERFIGVSTYEDSDDNDFDDFPERDNDYPRKGVQIVLQRNKRGDTQIGIYMNRKLVGDYIWREGMTERKFVEEYSQDWSGMTELRELVVKYKNLAYDDDDAGRRAMFGDGKRRIGGSGEQPPNAGPPPPNLRLANAVVYEFANQRVVRIEYNEREQVISRQTFRSTKYLDANHRIIYQGGLQEVPDEERDVFWEAITEANRGREGKIELLLDED